MQTLGYWISRLEPIIRSDRDHEIIVVFANRCGTEGNAVYAGTSAVVGIQAGEIRLYGILGRGEEELLVVDTSSQPYAKLAYQQAAGRSASPHHDSAKRGDEHGREKQN